LIVESGAMEKPKEQRTLSKIFFAIFDRRLFGDPLLFYSVPFLVVMFSVQITIYVALNSVMLYFYIPLFIILVLFSGSGSKNMNLRHREVHGMGYSRVILFSLISIMASLTPFAVNQPLNPAQAQSNFSFSTAFQLLPSQ
jgi:hypothetical protein